jgi:hypothetical protein
MYHIWSICGKPKALGTNGDGAEPIAENDLSGEIEMVVRNEKARQRRTISLIFLSNFGCGDRI